jgi:hypothetical protein
MVSHAPPVVVSLPVLRPDWETLSRPASRRSKPPNLGVCPAPSSLHQFCGATDKPKPAWFWGPNQETTVVILRPKSPNQSCRFWGPNRETHRHQFWGQTGEIIDLGFEAQPGNPCFSSPRARCRPHTASPDLSINQSLSTRPVQSSPVLCTRSLTPTMILIAAHHAAPAACTPRDKQTWFSKETKNNGKTTEMSWILIQTPASQWLITIKPKNWPLGFSASKSKEIDDMVIREQEANTMWEQAEAKLADLEKKTEAIEGKKKDQGLLLETAR